MIRLRLAALAALTLAATPAGAQTDASVIPEDAPNWRPFAEAVETVRADSSILLIHLYAKWCGWCVRLDRDVYTDDAVQAFVDEHYTATRIDIESDELSFFPILYWPVREDTEPMSDKTLAKIDAYMKQGGMIIFDTRDQERVAYGGAQGKALTRLIGQLDIPPLEPVPENHVLTKSFYLMNSFPGRWDGGSLWVEAEPTDEAERSERSRRTDGVSSRPRAFGSTSGPSSSIPSDRRAAARSMGANTVV